MHVMGVKNVHDVLPEISVVAKQVQPQGTRKTKGLKPHSQQLEDLAVVQWALGGRVTLVDVIDKGGMISLHSSNKEYVAVVWLSHLVTEADFECSSIFKELELQQKTPVRVLHQRSPLTGTHHSLVSIPFPLMWRMRCEQIKGSQKYFFVILVHSVGKCRQGHTSRSLSEQFEG
ncbi:unnamed protein product [Sphagnum balticum]